MEHLLRKLPVCCVRARPIVVPLRLNSNRCRASKQARYTYPRMYKTTIVNEDGSTYTIRFKEPRRLIELPIDIVAMTDVDRKKLWLSRQERKEDEAKDELEDDFKVDDYKHLWK